MKKMLILFVALLSSVSVFGQDNVDGKTVSRGKIYLTDSQVIEGQYIVFTTDSIEYYTKDSKDLYALSLNDVTKVSEYDGNYGNTGIWIGSFAGAGIGVVVALGTKETETTGIIQTTTIQTWPIYLFTGVGTLMGYMIGKGSEDWKTVYENTTAVLDNFDIKLNGQNDWMVAYTVYF